MYTHNPLFSHKDVPLFKFSPLRGASIKKSMERIYDERSRRTYIIVGTTFCFFVLSLFAFLISMKQPGPSSTPVAAAAPALEVIIETDAPPTEITIARTGLIALRGAEVVAVDGPILTVQTEWGSVNFTWTVHTDTTKYEKRYFGTKFIDSEGERISPSEVEVGDFVTVSGTLAGEHEQPTIHAETIRQL
jgi:hypothetical protein